MYKLNWILLLLVSVAPNFSVAEESKQSSLIVALKPDKNPEAMLEERKQLQGFLSNSLKKEVKVIVPLSGAVIQEGLANGTIDLAYVSGMEMIKAEASGSAELLLATELEGKPFYQSYWLVKKDSPLKNVSELKGKPIAFASRTSTSGFLIPTYDLVKQKLLAKKANPEEFFGKGNVTYGSGYVSAIERVLQGQADAAAVSDYVMNKDKHLTPAQKAQLKILAKQGPVPTHILAVRKSLSSTDKKSLEKAFLKMNEQNQILEKIFNAKLIRTTSKKHLAGLKEALDFTGIVLE